eukprot:CAMPEP_0117421858 /NCGR_PEP_ID=MMETSP0758-20121206/2825_1 /TAXON_ID=63605 /ORGANISM="Percolomonas cosmopolitus, Strain AE-1 (ATCC 50343)" /LENGTH=233 /DNA_ID=CAMNT_0005204153 /DNA_START=324 /DNA_END=1022 /DNA_ORIENTATION=+
MKNDLKSYKNLGEFFIRELKSGVRPIQNSDLVAPCDARVLQFGRVPENGKITHVKGYAYPIELFLGENTLMEKKKKENRLYQIVFYLSPGDCHRYYSPADWTVNHRRHFPGGLYSVAPMLIKYVNGLFAIQERVVLHGTWGAENNGFSMNLVGAMNVGSMTLNFDESLRTNQMNHWFTSRSQTYEKTYKDPVDLQKGEEVGVFHLGSTIVLIFEASKDFQFGEHIQPHQPIKI